jgi:hypothetical protein
MTVTHKVLMCDQKAVMTWIPYVGSTVINYEIWGKINNTWELFKITNFISDTIDVTSTESYCIYIKANFANGKFAFSSPDCFTVPLPGSPSYHYF